MADTDKRGMGDALSGTEDKETTNERVGNSVPQKPYNNVMSFFAICYFD